MHFGKWKWNAFAFYPSKTALCACVDINMNPYVYLCLFTEAASPLPVLISAVVFVGSWSDGLIIQRLSEWLQETCCEEIIPSPPHETVCVCVCVSDIQTLKHFHTRAFGADLSLFDFGLFSWKCPSIFICVCILAQKNVSGLNVLLSNNTLTFKPWGL